MRTPVLPGWAVLFVSIPYIWREIVKCMIVFEKILALTNKIFIYTAIIPFSLLTFNPLVICSFIS
jgi:hypothetical protein